ncbi:hypothetical protein NQ314_019697 [Rhamnusium bicolor]|uniref:Uncharacterized protein n=1 Tax=Rhamnusium bicolor TaxID=1586634 RepID=A0AAV8WNR6_9CUCU|nr:hypothetical protein NQ314_019697 [Rhamnusium bicolor]
MTSVASLPSENDVKADFFINGIVNKEAQNNQHPIFNIKQPFNGSHYSCNELENINPPSLFNEITDFCNSLADIATEAICSETDIFEDCYTHMADTTLQDENVTLAEDVTEFTDAHSATPLQSDISSAESTPKRLKSLSKSMTTKQRRNLARDRYKTYTVAAEMVMREEGEKQRENSEVTEDFKTVQEQSERSTDDTTNVSPTYSVSSSKLTPKERRQLNSQIQSCDSNSCSSSPTQSPARTKLSIRRNFMQKRLENKDRFRTQTLSESSFSPEVSSASPPLINGEAELHLHLQKEADLVLRTLRDTKTTQDELLDCETLSLVSNDDDSEHNSGGSVNYRTYHKSWGFRKNNIPVINPDNNQNGLVNCQPNLANDPENLPDDANTNNVQYNTTHSENSEEENEQKTIGKPKIVKPGEKRMEQGENTIIEEEGRGIRGRRKPLYSKSNFNNKIVPKSIKPVKTMTSNLVKNVTSTLKYGTPLKSVVNKQIKTVAAKPPVVQSRMSSGYGSKPLSTTSSPKTSPARVPLDQNIPKASSKIPTPASATKIPTFASKIARSAGPTSSKFLVPTQVNRQRQGMATADSREPVRKMQTSPSSQSLKNDGKMQNGAVKRSSIPSPAQRSNTFDNKDGVILRSKAPEDEDPTKRVSRLGSFIIMDESEDGIRLQQAISAAATTNVDLIFK